MPYALCPMPYALCPMPYALFPMPYSLFPMPRLITSHHFTISSQLPIISLT